MTHGHSPAHPHRVLLALGGLPNPNRGRFVSRPAPRRVTASGLLGPPPPAPLPLPPLPTLQSAQERSSPQRPAPTPKPGDLSAELSICSPPPSSGTVGGVSSSQGRAGPGPVTPLSCPTRPPSSAFPPQMHVLHVTSPVLSAGGSADTDPPPPPPQSASSPAFVTSAAWLPAERTSAGAGGGG